MVEYIRRLLYHPIPTHLTGLGKVIGSLQVETCFQKISFLSVAALVWVFPKTLKRVIFKTCSEIPRVDLHLDMVSLSAGDIQDVIFHL